MRGLRVWGVRVQNVNCRTLGFYSVLIRVCDNATMFNRVRFDVMRIAIG